MAKQFIHPGQSDWKPFQLFEREVRVLRSLSHPQIPRFLDAFEDQPPGTFYLVMERVEGQSLCKYRQDAHFQQHELYDILADVCRVLQYLHTLQPPVIHRDVKPANLVRDHEGLVHLVDFGGVRDAFRSEGGSTVVGTFGYMAPEQLHGLAAGATDIYALGMTIASLATGLEPEQIPRRGLRLNLEPLFPAGARRLAQLIGQMTEPDPEDRLGSAAAVLQRVEQIRAARPRSGLRQPEQTISAVVRVEAWAVTSRVGGLEVGGCQLEWLDRQVLDPGPGAIELVLLVDGVELEGTTPSRSRAS